MKTDYRLTTVDNPFNPFDDFTSWLLFDNEHNYFTLNLLDRVSHYSDDMTEEEIDKEHERAMNEILENDFLGIYMKVGRNETENHMEM